MYYDLYRTTNLINNKIYIGKHKTNNLDDGYMGSGKILKQAIKKYGVENFKKEIIEFYNSDEEVFLAESELVNKQFVKDENTYNLSLGGPGGYPVDCNINKVAVKDKNGSMFQVNINDSRYLSGELSGVTAGKTIVKDKDGNILYVDKDDSRILSNEVSGFFKGMVTTKDKNGNIFHISMNDERYISGELVSVLKNRVICFDTNKQSYIVDKTDPRYLSGELKHYFQDAVSVKDKDGKKYRLKKDDPRLLSKDFVGITKGKVLVKENEKIFYVSKTDPRYLSGELKYFRTGQPLSDMQKMRISEGIKLRNSLLEKYYTVGSKWLHNNILKKNKQVSSDLYEEYIKNGWEKGRVKF
jgi:hypothetical protein